MVLEQWQECKNRQSSFIQNMDSSCEDKHWSICAVWGTVTTLTDSWKCFWKLACRRFCALLGGFVFILDFYVFSEYVMGLDIKMCHSPPPMLQGPTPCSNPSSRPSCTSKQFRTVRQLYFISQMMCRLYLMFECQKQNGPIDWGEWNKEGKKN